MVEEILMEFGLSEKEARALVKLIGLGGRPIASLAKHLRLPRTTTYALVERLVELGYAEFFKHRGVKYVRAIAVEQLGQLLERERLRVEYNLDLFKKRLPDLHRLEARNSIVPKVRFFEGPEKVSEMYETLMRLSGYSAFFNPKLLKEKLPKYFYDLPQHYISSGVSAREIMVDCEEAYEYRKIHQSPNYQMKVLPKERQLFGDMLITENYVFLISFGEDQIAGTEIADPFLAGSQLSIFETLWEILEEI